MKCDSSPFVKVTKLNVLALSFWLETEDGIDWYTLRSYDGAVVIQNCCRIQRAASGCWSTDSRQSSCGPWAADLPGVLEK